MNHVQLKIYFFYYIINNKTFGYKQIVIVLRYKNIKFIYVQKFNTIFYLCKYYIMLISIQATKS